MYWLPNTLKVTSRIAQSFTMEGQLQVKYVYKHLDMKSNCVFLCEVFVSPK